MMLQSSIFRWRHGAGWFVLSSSDHFRSDHREAIDSRMLNRCAADGALVYIWAASDLTTAEQYLTYISDLGGRSGYPLDVIAEDDDSLMTQLGEAGIVVVGDGPHRDNLYNGLHGAAIKAISHAYERGALVMGAGAGAEVFGQWLVDVAATLPRPGLGWLANAAVLTGSPDNARQQALQHLLQEQPLAYGLDIGPDSALALGPEGHVELWGNRQIKVSLGRAYSAQG